MTKYIRKPFDLDAALKGARVVFKDGEAVEELHKIGDNVVVLAKGGSVYTYDTAGWSPELFSSLYIEEPAPVVVKAGTRLTYKRPRDGTEEPRVVVEVDRDLTLKHVHNTRGTAMRWLVINPVTGETPGWYPTLDSLTRDVGEGRCYQLAEDA